MKELLSICLPAVFVLNLLMLIVLFIGWLTHANYYYKVVRNVPSEIIFLYVMPSSLVSFMGVLGYIVNQPDMFKGAALFSSMLFGFALLLVTMFFIVEGIVKIHNYFGEKRGRN